MKSIQTGVLAGLSVLAAAGWVQASFLPVFGGTAPANVRKQAKRWLARLRKARPEPPRPGARATQEGPTQADLDREVSLP